MKGVKEERQRRCGSDDIPDILGGVAEATARDTRTQAVVADTDLVVDKGVGKRVVTLGHGPHKDTDAILGADVGNVIPHPHHGCIEAEGHLPTSRGKMIGDGVLDHLEKLLLRVG